MQTDLFSLVNNADIDYKDFLSTHYGFVWKKDKTACPFHADDERNPNLSYHPTKKILKCFVCEAGGGDLINFVRDYKTISKLDACMEILDLEKIYYERPNETTTETKEEIEARQKAFAIQQQKNNETKLAKEKEEIASKQKAINKATREAPSFSKEWLSSKYSNMRNAMFPHARLSSNFIDYEELYIGYDTKHDSICILNRINDKAKTTFTIKHREKFEWNKEEKKFEDFRKSGKWIGNFDATTHLFPLDYYQEKSKEDETVFIVEGEKDALNLLSYDINVLTLGGAGTEWTNYKEVVKDKIVYIWFDNDNAGYKGAIKRYNELKDVAKEIYIVLFYHINSSLPKNYDISDFIKEKAFENKTQLLHSIAYSSYKLTTSLIENIEDYTELDLQKFYSCDTIRTIDDIQETWKTKDKDNQPVNIIRANGQKDIKGLAEFIEHFKNEKKYKNFHKITTEQIALNLIGIDDDKREEKSLELVELMKNLALNYETLHKDYSQTHISDMVEAFEMMGKRTGNTFAKQGDSLAVWTGTHYKRFDIHDDLEGFILKDWMPNARVDKKKRSTENVKKILQDVYTGAVSLDKIKYYKQKGKRVINFTNGTLFITAKGKVTFKNVHDKKDACTNILEFAYDEKATCPKWNKFLNRNFPDKNDQATIMEFIGYCFMPSHEYEKFLYLYGSDGANGKSVILNTVKSFFGEDNISALNLQDLKGHPLDQLVNKVLNIGSELDAKGLKDGQIGVLKALTSSDDSIPVDPKFTRGFTLLSENQPKMMFAGNGELTPGSIDGGILRRVLPINCDITISDKEKVRGLEGRFWIDEMDGILNLALKHLSNLIQNNGFTQSQKSKEMITEYRDQSNPIRRYISDCLELDEAVIVPKDLLYAHYKEYMKEKGSMPLSQPKFFNKITIELKKIQDIGQQRISVPGISKDRPRFIQGIYCNANDVFSFDYEKVELQTKSINYDLKSKRVVIREMAKEDQLDFTGES